MASKVISPFSFYGGKARMASLICDMLDYDETDTYIEPFGGACRVLLNKPRHEKEIYNDFGIGLYQFFLCMSNPEIAEQVISKLYEVTLSEEIFYDMVEYKIKHETEPTDYICRRFKRFIYECGKNYGMKELRQLSGKISKREYEEIIGLSQTVSSGLNSRDRCQLEEYLGLYETYWEDVKDEYERLYKSAEEDFEEEWEKAESILEEVWARKRRQGIDIKINKDRYKARQKHNVSHAAALGAIDEGISEAEVLNGTREVMITAVDMDMAVATFLTYYMSRDGMGLDYSENKCRSNTAYYKQLLKLEEVAERMQGVCVQRMNAMILIELYKNKPNAMMYLDPSYLNPEDMKKDLGKGIYNRSFGYYEHKQLLQQIQDAKAKILISNYDVDLYNKYLDEAHGWTREEFETTTGVGGKQDNKRLEVLWRNY